MNKLEANLVLISVTVCGGCQYIFYKNLSVSGYALVSITAWLACLLLAAIFFEDLKAIGKKIIIQSALLSTFLFGFNIFLTIASEKLEPSAVAFLGGLYIPMVLFITLFFKGGITLGNILGTVGIIIGILFVVEMDIAQLFNKGTLYMLIADVFFALYVFFLSKGAAELNPGALSTLQMFFTGLYGFIACVIVNPLELTELNLTRQELSSILLLAIFVKAYSTAAQTLAQRFVSPINASIIFSTESVFALIFSLFISMSSEQPEILTIGKVIGCVTIVLSGFISDSDFLRIKNHDKT